MFQHLTNQFNFVVNMENKYLQIIEKQKGTMTCKILIKGNLAPLKKYESFKERIKNYQQP